MQRPAILRLVTRARRRLNAALLLKAAARGALLAAPVALILFRLRWPLFAAGALAGAAILRRRVSDGEAALWLDARLGTQQRIATVATRGPDLFTEYVAAEIAECRLPERAWPREAAWALAVAFLLFSLGLLAQPEPVVEKPAFSASPAMVAASAPRPVPDASEALAGLAAGETPSPEAAQAVRENIEALVARPEERRGVHEALDRALGGDAGAAREVAKSLGGIGEGGTGDAPGVAAGTSRAGPAGLVYPDHEEFLRAWRRAVTEGRQR